MFKIYFSGKRIDEHMTDEGFNNEIGTDKTNGFVFGGNTKYVSLIAFLIIE